MSVFTPPREGITLEYLLRPVSVLLHPIISASLLLAAVKRPAETQKFVSSITKNAISFESFKLTVKILLAAGTISKVNGYLNRLAVNNYATDHSWDWSREIVLCTGGSSGIGHHIVDQLAKRGVKVVILDVNPPTPALPRNVSFFRVDLTSTQEIQNVASRIRQEIGNPSVLINNAGTGSGATILDETEQDLQRTFDVNILAHFKLVKEFLPHMSQRNHGHIVTIASMASFISVANNVSYSATKAGALAFHEGLAQELKARVVHPFWVRTPLTHELTTLKEWKEFTLEPETVAEAVVSQIFKGESAQLIIPARFNFAGGLRGWPSWLQELVRGSGALPQIR
ncbi:hypothetical protein LTR47_005080 [Exophiala xenobiotica]|nr:hypothetical protein LTR47_005080 [Exophiala xenobiotica]KAK5246357.1 hypothetical protein LTS06_008305 [Exophiala xenobiotica]KAK5390813.1 hypothetical protein LTS03_000183 [Exophiala xenobiotica]KAK5407874.1 hypothetical protein LTR06_007617 [Exophiala xenobiotica]